MQMSSKKDRKMAIRKGWRERLMAATCCVETDREGRENIHAAPVRLTLPKNITWCRQVDLREDPKIQDCSAPRWNPKPYGIVIIIIMSYLLTEYHITSSTIILCSQLDSQNAEIARLIKGFVGRVSHLCRFQCHSLVLVVDQIQAEWQYYKKYILAH